MRLDSTHQCPAPRCQVVGLPQSVLACPRHWRMLPRHIKTAVTNAWRRGTVLEHSRARAAAVNWWEAHT
jgi:hypothetical protein